MPSLKMISSIIVLLLVACSAFRPMAPRRLQAPTSLRAVESFANGEFIDQTLTLLAKVESADTSDAALFLTGITIIAIGFGAAVPTMFDFGLKTLKSTKE